MYKTLACSLSGVADDDDGTVVRGGGCERLLRVVKLPIPLKDICAGISLGPKIIIRITEQTFYDSFGRLQHFVCGSYAVRFIARQTAREFLERSTESRAAENRIRSRFSIALAEFRRNDRRLCGPKKKKN